MHNWLIVGGLIFWVYWIVVSIIFLACIANEVAWVPMLLAICTAIVMQVGFELPIRDYLPHTFSGWAVFIGSYAIIGVLWSIFKFASYYRKLISEVVENKARTLQQWKDLKPELTDAQLSQKWNDYVEQSLPSADSMKADIASWISYWPASALIYLLADVIMRFGEWIYDRIRGIYVAIAERLRNSIKDQIDK